MPFRYIIYFLKGVFTARAATRPALTEELFISTLATRTGLTRAQVEDVLRKLFAYLIELARQGIPTEFILDLFRLLPVLGGVYADANPAAPLIRKQLSLSIVPHPSQTAAMQEDCPVEKADEKTESKPQVDSVRATPSGALDHYGVGQMAGMEVSGDFFREARVNAPKPTAALCDAGGANPIALGVAWCTPTLLILTGAPTGTVGAKFLKISDADGNFFLYDHALNPG